MSLLPWLGLVLFLCLVHKHLREGCPLLAKHPSTHRNILEHCREQEGAQNLSEEATVMAAEPRVGPDQ